MICFHIKSHTPNCYDFYKFSPSNRKESLCYHIVVSHSTEYGFKQCFKHFTILVLSHAIVVPTSEIRKAVMSVYSL